MSFQLVRASEREIVIWHTEHGHIYGYVVAPDRHSLTNFLCRNIPDAAQDAQSLSQDAARFADEQARLRGMLA